MQRVTVFTVLLMWASIWGTISHLFSVSNLALKSLSGRSLLKVVDWQKSTGSFHVMTLDEVRQANFSIERENPGPDGFGILLFIFLFPGGSPWGGEDVCTASVPLNEGRFHVTK